MIHNTNFLSEPVSSYITREDNANAQENTPGNSQNIPIAMRVGLALSTLSIPAICNAGAIFSQPTITKYKVASLSDLNSSVSHEILQPTIYKKMTFKLGKIKAAELTIVEDKNGFI